MLFYSISFCLFCLLKTNWIWVSWKWQGSPSSTQKDKDYLTLSKWGRPCLEMFGFANVSSYWEKHREQSAHLVSKPESECAWALGEQLLWPDSSVLFWPSWQEDIVYTLGTIFFAMLDKNLKVLVKKSSIFQCIRVNEELLDRLIEIWKRKWF